MKDNWSDGQYLFAAAIFVPFFLTVVGVAIYQIFQWFFMGTDRHDRSG